MKSILSLFIIMLLNQSTVGQVVLRDISIILEREGDFVSAEMLIEDPQGRKTGREPFLDEEYSEIPGSHYTDSGVDSEDPNFPGLFFFDFGMDDPINGVYTLKFIGIDTDSFNLTIRIKRDLGNSTVFKFKGVTGRRIVSSYNITYHPDPDSLSVVRVINTAAEINTDLDLINQFGWITNQGIYNSLTKKLENAEDKHDKGQTNAAINQLNAFINEVEAQRGKHITEDAATILVEDVQYLIKVWEQ